MKHLAYQVTYNVIIFLSFLPLFLISLFKTKKEKKKIIFGSVPITNNKYWSEALKKAGHDSITLMSSYYDKISVKGDYDFYYEDFIPKIITNKQIKRCLTHFCVLLYIINNAKTLIISFNGFMDCKAFWKLEYYLFKMNNIKCIVLPYGGDAFMYSQIRNVSLKNAIQISYPGAARNEEKIAAKVRFWSKHADFIMVSWISADGFPRWDCCICQYIQINTESWPTKKNYSSADGSNAPVVILHTPNHRGFKGTEFLIQAVKELQQEGLKVELNLLEGVQNAEVKRLMQDVDILAEQFIFNGYALSGIEGMASGLPVLSNLEHEEYTTLFRRYSFLDECPILSTAPENLKENLRQLITNPSLRKELGTASRLYAEKYHSYEMTQYLFGEIFKKLDGEEIETMNLFHPLLGAYPKQKPKIIHPLKNNRL